MPLGAKLVIGWIMVFLAISVFWSFARLTTRAGDMIGIVIEIALLTGLYTRQTIAWYCARWMTGFGIVVTSILLLLATFGGTTKSWILGVIATEVALGIIFFQLLGRADSRALL